MKMKLPMITFAAAVGSANAYTTKKSGVFHDFGNPCMVKCPKYHAHYETLHMVRAMIDLCIDACVASDRALATATTCMAATPGYKPVNFEDNCDLKECDQWTCETWCTCYSDDDAAIYTRLGCDTVDDVPCQC